MAKRGTKKTEEPEVALVVEPAAEPVEEPEVEPIPEPEDEEPEEPAVAPAVAPANHKAPRIITKPDGTIIRHN